MRTTWKMQVENADILNIVLLQYPIFNDNVCYPPF